MSKQDKFLNEAKQMESLQDQINALREAMNASMADLGLGTLLQDPDTGLVYKIVKPNGTFVHYKDIDYVRTAKATERAGSLSKKEAEEAGFVVLKK